MIRKTIAILFCLLVSHIGFCQGNLQFNQVIQQSFNLTIPTTTATTLSTITVPVGKVLKIESACVATTTTSYLPGARLFMGDHCLWQLNYTTVGGLIVDRNLPLWLNAGTYSLQVYHSASTSVNLRASFSGIEFNVVP